MAIYHFSARIISRGKGRSATGAAAYRAGIDIVDERTGLHHQYAQRGGVLDHAILTPARAPDWSKDAASLWNAVEQFEKRKDAQLVRENILGLPCELTMKQNRDLVRGFVQEAYIKRGMVAQVDIHAPDKAGNQNNIHAHIMLTTRQITRNGFKEKKPRNWNEKKTLHEWREMWANHVNRALERAGHKERVDHRSFKDRGIEDREPTKHLGPTASKMERRGEKSRIGDENRAAQEFNKLVEKAKVIDLEIEREKRRLAARKMEGAYKQAAGQKKERLKTPGSIRQEYERAASNDNQTREEEAQQRRNDQHLHHLDQLRALESRQDSKRLALQKRLRTFYNTGQDRKELKELEDKKRRSRGDRERMEDLRLSIADADERNKEQFAGFARSCERDKGRLLERQAHERERLELELSGQAPERTAEHTRTAGRVRQPQGRERKR